MCNFFFVHYHLIFGFSLITSCLKLQLAYYDIHIIHSRLIVISDIKRKRKEEMSNQSEQITKKTNFRLLASVYCLIFFVSSTNKVQANVFGQTSIGRLCHYSYNGYNLQKKKKTYR